MCIVQNTCNPKYLKCSNMREKTGTEILIDAGKILSSPNMHTIQFSEVHQRAEKSNLILD